MVFGTPGGDQQDQWTLQFFLNVVDFGMSIQEALDAPTFHTQHFPSSFYPRAQHPGLVIVEGRIPEPVRERLRGLGHQVEVEAVEQEEAGRTLLRRTGMQAVLITRGSRGMALFQPKQPTVHVPIFGSDEVADVTGAGDTVIATLTVALAAGASFDEAAHLANFAGGVVVMKRGTATVSRAELTDAIEHATGN